MPLVTESVRHGSETLASDGRGRPRGARRRVRSGGQRRDGLGPRRRTHPAPECDGRPDADAVAVSTGDTVVWVWHGSGHNVRATARPRGSTFTGTPGDKGTTYDEGYEFAHTFEVAGEYEYHCYPYRNLGMQGTVTVSE